MKPLKNLLLGAVLVTTCVPCMAQAPNAEAIARTVLTQLAARDFAKVHAQFTELFGSGWTVDRLTAAWDSMVKANGAFRRPVNIEIQDAPESANRPKGTRIVQMMMEFEKATLDDCRVVVDPRGRVSGMHFGSKPKPVVSGVNRSHMGIYRALAELAVDNVKRNDLASAAKIARILEVTWDRAESDLQAKSKQTWDRVDGALDAFVLPIRSYQKTPPDPTKVDATYRAFLEQLKQADTEK
jgi:hypothetical protein